MTSSSSPDLGTETGPPPARPLELIACDGCGRHFATDDGPGMIAVLKGPCPDCGSRFRLIDPAETDSYL